MNASIGGELPDVCISEDAKLEESRKTLQFVHTALDKECASRSSNNCVRVCKYIIHVHSV